MSKVIGLQIENVLERVNRERKCINCDGTGKRLVITVEACNHGTIQKGGQNWGCGSHCRRCNGTGKITTCRREGTCFTCHGRGLVPY